MENKVALFINETRFAAIVYSSPFLRVGQRELDVVVDLDMFPGGVPY